MNMTSIAALEAGLGNLNANDQEFARSLLQQARRYGRLSDKQVYWVNKLAEKCVAGPRPMAQQNVGDFAGVIALFNRAKAHLKFPKVRLQTSDGESLCLSMAGANSKNPGWIQLTDGGRYGENIWYGRISPDGVWQKPDRLTPAKAAIISDLLTQLCADPAGTAAAYGKLTGNRCFCMKGLSDERSTAVGYGPICAAHFELPWG